MLTCVVHPGLKAQELVAQNSLSPLLLSEAQCLCDVCTVSISWSQLAGRPEWVQNSTLLIQCYLRLHMFFFLYQYTLCPMYVQSW